MSEEHAQAAQDMVEQEMPTAKQTTAGELLRQAREAAGMHVAALAVSMKVPVKKLEALEADRLDLLPDAVFVRALASSVCRTLKIDPAPVLALLPQTMAPQLKSDEWGINAPFRAPGDVSTVSMWDQLSRPGVLAALALLAAALVLIFLPSMEHKDAGGGSSSEVVVGVAAPAPAAVPEAAATAKPAGQPTEVSASVLPAAVAPAASTSPAVASPQVPPPSAALAVATPAVTAPPTAAAGQTVGVASTGGVLVFKARGPSWIEVTDVQGVVQLRRTLVTGETVGVSGALPLSVVIGRADVTEVQVRGKPFSLETVARDNVARFEVK